MPVPAIDVKHLPDYGEPIALHGAHAVLPGDDLGVVDDAWIVAIILVHDNRAI